MRRTGPLASDCDGGTGPLASDSDGGTGPLASDSGGGLADLTLFLTLVESPAPAAAGAGALGATGTGAAIIFVSPLTSMKISSGGRSGDIDATV